MENISILLKLSLVVSGNNDFFITESTLCIYIFKLVRLFLKLSWLKLNDRKIKKMDPWCPIKFSCGKTNHNMVALDWELCEHLTLLNLIQN